MEDVKINRRRQPRFHVEECQLRVNRQGFMRLLSKPSDGIRPVVNLSAGGLEFLASPVFRVGQRLRLVVDVPAFEEPLRIRARVRWTAPAAQGDQVRVGVEFHKPTDETLRRIERLETDGLLRRTRRDREMLI